MIWFVLGFSVLTWFCLGAYMLHMDKAIKDIHSDLNDIYVRLVNLERYSVKPSGDINTDFRVVSSKEFYGDAETMIIVSMLPKDFWCRPLAKVGDWREWQIGTGYNGQRLSATVKLADAMSSLFDGGTGILRQNVRDAITMVQKLMAQPPASSS